MQPLDELVEECGRLHGPMCAGQLLGARMAVLGCRLVGVEDPRGARSDLFSGNVQYRLNSFTTLAYEQGYYRTRAANRVGALPLFRGIPSYTTHNVRSEFATTFTF